MAKADDTSKKAAADKTATDKKVDEGKLKALGLAMEQITKQFGDGSIMKLGEFHRADVEVIPSGSVSVDIALGGGYPKGRIIEIYEAPGSSIVLAGPCASHPYRPQSPPEASTPPPSPPQSNQPHLSAPTSR